MRNILNPKLSVVITMYNNEKYIDECIKSVLNQKYQDFEIILVDADSKDNTAKICKNYEEKYDFITFVQAENKGPSHSRNEGMKYAKGEYLTFVDGDDIISDDMYSVLMQNMENENLDVIYCTCYRFFDDDIQKRSMRNIAEVYCENKSDIYNKMVLPLIGNINIGYEISGSMCMTIYKRNIITENNLFVRSMEDIFSEDNMFNIEYLICCQRAKTVNLPLYFYRKQPSSISNKVHDYTVPALKRFEKKCLEIGKNVGIDEKEIIKRCKVRFIIAFSTVIKKVIDEKSLKNTKIYIKNIIKDNKIDLSFTKNELGYVEFQVKLFWILLRYKMYDILYLLVKIYSRFVAR